MDPKLQALEVELLIETAKRRYGFDFSQYSRASLERRLANLRDQLGLGSVSEMIPMLLHQPEFIDRFVNGISVNVTEPFRDPQCFKALLESVCPTRETYPYFKVWHAGCASGEEVYSTAILLHEAGLLERAQIYATDINTRSLATAREAVYSEEALAKAEKHYLAAGGQARLSDYYVNQYGAGRFSDKLRQSVVFSQHNLVTDSPFGEMVLVICRNVLIYFERALQNRVVELFHASLGHRGFLMLGSKESLTYLPAGSAFEQLDREARIYRAL